jgi:competence protein ComEC
MEKYARNIKTIFLLILVVTTAVIWYAVFYFESHQNLKVTFFDVGQGDSIFIESPAGNQILIDGGPDDRVLAKLGRAMPFWDRSLDLVILTHPDKDHLAGLVDVLERYDISMILWTGVEHSSAEYQEWVRLLEEEKANVVVAERGQRVALGGAVFIDILAPFDNWRGRSATKINDTGIVSRLQHGNNSILLTGDISKSVEHRLIFESFGSPFFVLRSNVLKVAHHGSKTSSAEEFIAAVAPDAVVVQVGRKNRYGHPTQEVLERFAAVGSTIFRNDFDGDIRFVSNGVQYAISR